MTPRRTSAALLAVSALLAGCGPAKHLSMDLRTVSISVPRLVTPALQIVPVAPIAPPAALPPLPPVVTQLPPLPTAPPVAPVVQPPRAPLCPKAGQFDVPDVTAVPVLGPAPVPATYTQTVAGAFATPSNAGAISDVVTQTVTLLPRTTSTVGQVIDTWRVARVDASKKSTSVEVYRLLHASTSPAATPAGIYLVGLAWSDPVRGTLSFEPTGNGIYVLPDPVALSTSGGAQYAGTGTDAGTLSTLTVIRNVTGRKRVDACGKLIDTYTVEMTGVLTTVSSQRQISWTQQLATPYGGLDVQDTMKLSAADGSSWWVATRTATAVPKPVAS